MTSDKSSFRFSPADPSPSPSPELSSSSESFSCPGASSSPEPFSSSESFSSESLAHPIDQPTDQPINQQINQHFEPKIDQSTQHYIEQEIERRVEERLAALRQENEHLKAALQNQQQSGTSRDRHLALLQEIIDTLPVCISYVDANQRYQFVSKGYETWLGWNSDEILGQTLQDIIGADAYQVVKDKIDRVLSGETVTYEAAVPYQNKWRYINAILVPRFDQNQVTGWYALLTDITEKKIVEEALRQSEARFHKLATNIPGVIHRYVLHPDGTDEFTYMSPGSRELFEVEPEDVLRDTKVIWQMMHPHEVELLRASIIRSKQTMQPWCWEGRMITPSGRLKWFQGIARPERQLNGDVVWDGLVVDISDRKRAEDQVRLQAQREQALNRVIQAIRNSLELHTIFETAANEIGKLLQVDRAGIVQYKPDRKIWEPVAEYRRDPNLPSRVGIEIPDEGNPYGIRLRKLEVIRIDDPMRQENEIARSLSPKFPGSVLLVPVHRQSNIWGSISLIKLHHQWQDTEIELTRAIADQLAIAIYQSDLYQQVQHLNADLEDQIKERTAELKTALDFEALLKRVTDKVRDSLDEDHILQTAVNELGTLLKIDCCDTALYDFERNVSVVRYEHVQQAITSNLGIEFDMTEKPELYAQISRGHPFQFCFLMPEQDLLRISAAGSSVLVCPLMDERGLLGDMWLFKPSYDHYTEQEIWLVQQVANQCAIALRQARLYQTAQTQVIELERLNRLKDDFLSTVSHELRTPMSNIKMAIELFRLHLFQNKTHSTKNKASYKDNAQSIWDNSPPIFESPVTLQPTSLKTLFHYFQILRDECNRETELINDLLDLTRLDAEVEPLVLTSVDLKHWIPHIVEPFLERIRIHQQRLEITIPDHLPALYTDMSYLERIITELLHNACKYTPAKEQIIISVQENAEPQTDPSLLIRISNTGVTIPADECDRMFDKFYRIPNNDPWKHGGTGLGLALVKKRAERLGATIWAESRKRRFTVCLQCPISA